MSLVICHTDFQISDGYFQANLMYESRIECDDNDDYIIWVHLDSKKRIGCRFAMNKQSKRGNLYLFQNYFNTIDEHRENEINRILNIDE